MDALERIDLSMSQLDYVVKCWDTIIVGPEGETYGDQSDCQSIRKSLQWPSR